MKKGSYFRFWTSVILVVALFHIVLCPMAGAVGKAKNVIVLIADGCSSEQYTFVRWFKREPLSFDPIRVGAIRTHISDSVLADSAPAASAFATGVRTSDKSISVGPHGETISGVPVPPERLRYRPLATVLEGARLLKKATGIVATSRVTHATPAAYMAHVPHREMENEIMEQAVYQNVDVVLGGGMRHLLPKNQKGKRTDGENLLEVLKEAGYQIVTTREEMLMLARGKVFGMFAPSHMEPEIDRKSLHPEQPTLKEMTEKAIDILSRDPDGFFLMVEGSQIDWACHANDPAHLLSDMLAYDAAVKTALDFARMNGNTLVLAFSDHNTGGFSIGNFATDGTYSRLTPEGLMDPFRRMISSASLLWKRLEKEVTAEHLRQVVKEGWGMHITQEDAEKILALAEKYKQAPHYAFGEVLCARYTYVGWSTHGHCGGDVPLHAFGPEKPMGLIDGPDVGRICARSMGLHLDRLNERLFVEAGQAFAHEKWTLDKTDPENPVVKVSYKGKEAELPVNKNILKIGDRIEHLEGVVVYAPETGRVYIPQQAVHRIKGLKAALPRVAQ